MINRSNLSAEPDQAHPEGASQSVELAGEVRALLA
jgi:hypothetical protein